MIKEFFATFFSKDRIKFWTICVSAGLIYCVLGDTSTYATMISSILMVVSLAFMIIKNNKLIPKILDDKPVKMLNLFVAIVFVYLLFYDYSSFPYSVSVLASCYSMAVFCFMKEYPGQLKRMLIVLFVVWVVISFRAYYLLSTGEVNARYLASHVQTTTELMGGGFSFAVASTVLAVYLVELVIWGRIKKGSTALFVIAFVVLLTLVVLNTNSTITLLAMIFGYSFAVLLRLTGINTITKLNINKGIGLAFLLIVFIVLMFTKERIGIELVRNTSGAQDVVSQRLHEFGEFLIDRESIASGSDLDVRVERWTDSVKMFGENFFFGIMPKTGSNFYAMRQFGLGGHGELMDSFAKYGIVGAIPFLLIYFFAAKEDRARQINKTGFAYIITFIFLFTFNLCFYAQSNLVWFLIIPGINYLMCLSEQKGVQT